MRAGYGIFYDGFTNGTGGPLQASISALPWTQAYQLPGPGFDIANPYGGAATPFGSGNFVAPATVLTVQSGMRPPYSQNWNFSIERTIAKDYLLDVRYVGNKGTHLPRFIEGESVHLRAGGQREQQQPDPRVHYVQLGRRLQLRIGGIDSRTTRALPTTRWKSPSRGSTRMA